MGGEKIFHDGLDRQTGGYLELQSSSATENYTCKKKVKSENKVKI